MTTLDNHDAFQSDEEVDNSYFSEFVQWSPNSAKEDQNNEVINTKKTIVQQTHYYEL